MSSGTRRPLTAHRMEGTVALHWRRDPNAVEALLPPGTRPDVVDGSAWVGFVAYRFRDTRIPPLPPPGRLGTMTEVTIEVLTVDDEDRHGIVYRTIETDSVPAIAAARAGIGIPYTFARAGSRRLGDVVAHRSVRARAGASAAVRVRAVDGRLPAVSRTLTTRAGIVARHLGHTNWWTRTHPPLELRPVAIEELRGSLPAVVGLPGLFDTIPESAVLAAPTTVTYAWGGRIR